MSPPTRLKIIAISGKTKEFTLRRIWKNYKNVQMPVFGISICFLFSIMDYMQLSIWLDPPERFLFWMILLGIYFTIHFSGMIVLYYICKKWPRISIYIAFIAIPSAFVLTAVIRVYIGHLTDNNIPETYRFLPLFLTHYMVILFNETFVFEYIFTPSPPLEQTTASPSRKTEAVVRKIYIGSGDFIIKDILHIQSMENYLEITTHKGSFLELGVLKEVSAKLPMNIGCQISRSVWIAYSSIYKTTKTSKNTFIVTIDNKTFKAPLPLRCNRF